MNPNSPAITLLLPLPFTIPPRKPDVYVKEGDKLKIGSIDVEVMHVPGHAAGHVVYYLPKEHVLVGGDMIIMGGIGRTDLPDSNWPDMQRSLRRIMDLPEETTLLPGHGAPSTLQRELHSNCMIQDALET
jgi:glyoxylase-like metal-dependent hydrolase (beta-lactamase superfamily II)